MVTVPVAHWPWSRVAEEAIAVDASPDRERRAGIIRARRSWPSVASCLCRQRPPSVAAHSGGAHPWAFFCFCASVAVHPVSPARGMAGVGRAASGIDRKQPIGPRSLLMPTGVPGTGLAAQPGAGDGRCRKSGLERCRKDAMPRPVGKPGGFSAVQSPDFGQGFGWGIVSNHFESVPACSAVVGRGASQPAIFYSWTVPAPFHERYSKKSIVQAS